MDRRVKERLIGATILVLLIVVVVPELLSGPKPVRTASPPASMGPAEATHSVTVDLATSKTTASPNSQSVDEAASASMAVANDATPAGPGEPANLSGVDAAGTDDAANAAKTADAANAESAAKAADTASAANTANSAGSAHAGDAAAATNAAAEAVHGTWAVQLGSFAHRRNAEHLVRRLRPYGAPVHLATSGKGAAARYRVRIGPVADRAAAERLVAKLKRDGHTASLVLP